MIITKQQFGDIRRLLTSKDKDDICELTGIKKRTLEAILQGARINTSVAQTIYEIALRNLEYLSNIFNDINRVNIKFIQLKDFQEAKKQDSWHTGKNYQYYIDTYLQLCHESFNDIESLWKVIETQYSYIIPHSYYCINLIIRLTGCKEKDAVTLYNKKLPS